MGVWVGCGWRAVLIWVVWVSWLLGLRCLWFEFYVAVFAVAGLRLRLGGNWFGWLLMIGCISLVLWCFGVKVCVLVV